MMRRLKVKHAERLVSVAPIILREEASIYEAVEKLINTPHARSAYVVDEQGHLEGIVTLTDLVNHVFSEHYFESKRSKQNMSQIVHSENAATLACTQPVCVTAEEPLEQAVQKILQHNLQEIPVVDDEGVVVGDLNLLDLLSVWFDSTSTNHRQKQDKVRLSRYVNKKTVSVSLKAETKGEALDELLGLLSKAPQVKDIDELSRMVKQRESLVTTGVGRGVAIPHARCVGVSGCAIAVGVSKKGIDFGAHDKEPVKIIFLLAVQEAAGFPYAQLLARVIQLLNRKEHTERLLSASSASDILSVIEQFDREPGCEEKEAESKKTKRASRG